MLDPQRVKEMFWLFSKVLPIYDNSGTQKLNSVFGKEFTKLVPDLCLSVGDLSSKNLEIFELYLEFIESAIFYMRGDRSEIPVIENQANVAIEMKKALEEFEKNAKPIKF